MSITTRISIAVSKRKIVKSRLTAAADLGRLRPELLRCLVDPAEFRADEADPDRHRQRRADDAEDHPELIPRRPRLLDQRDAEAEHEEEDQHTSARVPIQVPIFPSAASVGPSCLRSKTIPSVVSVMSPPTHTVHRENMEREVDLVRRGRVPEEDDRAGEEQRSGNQSVPADRGRKEDLGVSTAVLKPRADSYGIPPGSRSSSAKRPCVVVERGGGMWLSAERTDLDAGGAGVSKSSWVVRSRSPASSVACSRWVRPFVTRRGTWTTGRPSPSCSSCSPSPAGLPPTSVATCPPPGRLGFRLLPLSSDVGAFDWLGRLDRAPGWACAPP